LKVGEAVLWVPEVEVTVCAGFGGVANITALTARTSTSQTKEALGYIKHVEKAITEPILVSRVAAAVTA
jgi:hypothetical protein